MARAIPGAVYSSEHGAMVIPVVTPRAAIVALKLFPDLGNEYPELIEARDTLIRDVRPTDNATRLQLKISAPHVRQTLRDQGSDWMVFDWLDDVDGHTPGQETDLGYLAAILKHHGFAYCGWSRGLGKTLGTAAIVEANDYDRVLISVLNSSKSDVWLRELQARNATHEIFVLPNEKAKREGLLEKIRAGDMPARYILVVHHEAMALVAKHGPKSVAAAFNGWRRLGVTWDLFVTDEAHRLKSAGRKGSQFHRASCKVPALARLALSGSVYENSWEEVYGPLHWLAPHVYHSQWETWNLRHFDYVESYGKICVGVLEGHEQPLRDELGVFMVIREKLSKAIELEHYVDLAPAQRAAYDELRDEYATALDDGTLLVAEAGVVMLGKLRQIATGLELVSKTLVSSTKLDAAMQVISDYEDFDDFFVACWYKASAEALRDRLIEAGYEKVFLIDGDVPAKKRAAIIQATRDANNEDVVGYVGTDPVILIGTIATLGESANLQHLNHVIRIDRSFNPALNRQVVDRCDRTGQEREVRLTDIVARDTVDELVVMPNLANKDAFRALVLGRGA